MPHRRIKVFAIKTLPFLISHFLLLTILLEAESYAESSFTDTFVEQTVEENNFWRGKGVFGLASVDINGDGYLDIWLSHHESHKNFSSIFLNKEGARFEYEQTLSRGGDLHGASWADYDNDGDPDLAIMGGGAFDGPLTMGGFNSLYVTENRKVIDEPTSFGVRYGRGRSLAWFDANNDGNLDLFLFNKTRGDKLAPSLLLTQEKGKFRDSKVVPYLLSNLALVSHLNTQSPFVYSPGIDVFPSENSSLANLHEITKQKNLNIIRDLAVADFNGDGVFDIFFTRREYGKSPRIEPQTNGALVSLPSYDGKETVIHFGISGDFVLEVARFVARHVVSPGDVYLGAHQTSAFVETAPSSLKKDIIRNIVLSSNDKKTYGFPDLGKTQKEGLYIGFDPRTKLWSMALISSLEVLSTQPAFFRIKSEHALEKMPFVGSSSDRGTEDQLLISKNGVYEVATKYAGLDFPTFCESVVAGDFDNDMDVDLFLACGNEIASLAFSFYENDGKGRFTNSIKPSFFPHFSDYGQGQRISSADFDNDGCLDVFAGSTAIKTSKETSLGAPAKFFKNTCKNKNNWVMLKLVGVESNRDGIGAKVVLETNGITQVREQTNGMHLWSQNDSRVHFGLGKAKVIDSLTVYWPSGQIQKVEKLSVNKIFEIVENKNQAVLAFSNKPTRGK